METTTIQFCPYCGQHLERKIFRHEMQPFCPNCGRIYFPDPKVAAAVLVEENSRILLTQRSVEPDKGKWALPAGFINAFEDPANAARRECFEETGLKVEILDLLTLISGREQAHGADFILIYRAKIIGGILKAGDDAVDAQFFNRENLPPLAFRATHQALGLVSNHQK